MASALEQVAKGHHFSVLGCWGVLLMAHLRKGSFTHFHQISGIFNGSSGDFFEGFQQVGEIDIANWQVKADLHTIRAKVFAKFLDA